MGVLDWRLIMKEHIDKLAEEAMRLEYNVSKLYMIFRDAHPEDEQFWWQLVIEESNHAALIKSGVEYFIPVDAFPDGMFPDMKDLQQANAQLKSLLEQYATNPPSREAAFNIALKTEISAGEMHFQRAMTKKADSDLLRLFQKLNQDDKDHAKRIRAYMQEHQILIQD